MKECFKCHTIKPLSDFYKHSGMSDGHLNKCKDCTKSENRANRNKNKEYYREYDKLRYKHNPKRKETMDNKARRFASNNPKKRFAHNAVNNAIRDGRLGRSSNCESCGATHYLHAHHDDYDEPLIVRWLCPSCHAQWHNDNGEGKNG